MTDDAGARGFVRPFVLTGGRTRSDVELRLESMVGVVADLDPRTVPFEAEPLVAACGDPQSLAELASTLDLPIGVVKVVVSDLLASKILEVHDSRTTADVDISLLDRILDGVRAL